MIRKILLCSFALVITALSSNAQLNEGFDDGDFSNNPIWTGDTASFNVNPSLQLQSNNTIANSTFYLSTPNELATETQWEMYVQLAFNPSSANYVDVYLTASASNLTLNSTIGYFVRIGNTDDNICLYRKDAGGVITKIIDGTKGILNTSNNLMKIKVIRDASYKWTLSRDLSATGNGYITEGFVTDNLYSTSAYFGFLVKQSTASFFQQHFFDDIEIKNYIPDVTPPSIQSATAISSSALDVLFSESIEKTSGQDLSNYFISNGLGNPVSATVDAMNSALVHLIFSNNFISSVQYSININGVQDLSGNAINNGTINFSFYLPQPRNVIIDEIMAKPSPAVGLPNNEWVELTNTSSFPINIRGWRLAKTSSVSGPMPNFILQPDSFVIICTGSAVAGLSAFGPVISVTSFPSLLDAGDLISLISSSGVTMHAVEYDVSWYQNDLKKNGGWSLEMVDTKNPCSGITNWKSSIDPKGGTPGTKNSVNGNNPDNESPGLLRAFPSGNSTVTLVFDKPLDSLNAANSANYTIDNGVSVLSASTIPPIFNKVTLVLNNPLSNGTVYNITAVNVSDCRGNTLGPKNKAKFGLPQEADSMDVVINEILYKPKPNGVDYVEVYNRSQKIVDLSHMYIANRNSSYVISSIQQVSSESILLFPAEYLAITTSPQTVKEQYLTTNPEAFLAIATMPSYPNTSGDVILLNIQGKIIDEVAYSDKWQFPLISNTEGVALERIDYNGPSMQSNFHSAATSVGYGTPGYKNSQYRLDEELQGEIKVSPDIFSPDNDGTDDFATIDYNFPTPGYVANITIFDAKGYPVRYLQRNALSGVKGYYRWDGLDDKGRKLPQGIYIIYTEIFNTSGKKKQFKNTIVLARKY